MELGHVPQHSINRLILIMSKEVFGTFSGQLILIMLTGLELFFGEFGCN